MKMQFFVPVTRDELWLLPTGLQDADGRDVDGLYVGYEVWIYCIRTY